MQSKLSKYVHIIPMGLEYDRIWYGFKEYPPYRVYFIRNIEPEEHKEDDKGMTILLQELKAKISLAETKEKFINTLDFEECLLETLRIMHTEKREGNVIIVNLSGGSSILRSATIVAGLFIDSSFLWIMPKEYVPRIDVPCADGKMFNFPLISKDFVVDKDGRAYTEVFSPRDFLLRPSLPEELEKDLLIYIAERESVIASLSELVGVVSKKTF